MYVTAIIAYLNLVMWLYFQILQVLYAFCEQVA